MSKSLESFKRKMPKMENVQDRLISGYRHGKGSVADIANKSLVNTKKLDKLLSNQT